MESRLERCSLKEAGISASGVQKFLDEIQAGGYHLHSLMLTRHGKVAYECSWKPYQMDEVHLMHSFTEAPRCYCHWYSGGREADITGGFSDLLFSRISGG